MRKVQPLSTLFVPTVVIDGARHIIPKRDGPPLCGAEGSGKQTEPQTYAGANLNGLCPRCRQKYARRVLEAAHGPLTWEQ